METSITESKLKQIKEQISNQANPKNGTEITKLLDNPKLLQQTLNNAAENFKKETGREMTYSEMREMMG
jgi:hypothetical protein